MNYIKWNNAIAEFYFNPDKAEEEVYLFITRRDIINIGRANGLIGGDQEIFNSYLSALREGLPGKPKNDNILDHAIYSYEKWKKKPFRIDGIKITFPLYIGYLSIFILPLTEKVNPNLRSDAYYPPVRDFLSTYNLPNLPNQSENLNWNDLWEDLEKWTIIDKNTELGYFELHPFNKNWVYVGKPLSQSIFPIQAIRQLPRFFDYSDLVPGDQIDGNTFRALLSCNGKRYLGLAKKVINAIKDPENELGLSIIRFVRKNYQEWTGRTDQYDSDTDTIKKGNTIAQLRLCIGGNQAKGYQTYFRLYTKLAYPEDLTFVENDNKYKCEQYVTSWSKPIRNSDGHLLKFQDKMELEDRQNKWKVKFQKKDVRLFLKGINFRLSDWVEVQNMVASKMLLLAKHETSDSIESWGEFFKDGDFKKLPTTGLPPSHELYEFINPPISHPDIPELVFKSDKKVLIKGGMKIGVRTWLKNLLPDVELQNGRGTETVYLVYEESNQSVQLERKEVDQPTWSLPSSIELNEGFYIKVEGEKVDNDQLKNYVVGSQSKIELLKEDTLPARNQFGQIIERDESTEFVIGSRLISSHEENLRKRQSPYLHFFTPRDSMGQYSSIEIKNSNSLNELLITYLTVKGKSKVKDYFDAFEEVYQERFSSEEIERHKFELSKLKRWSLNYLDYLGIIDYEYTTKNIIVNPPQFILIPTDSGRKMLLIGGRTPELISRINSNADKQGLHINFEPQDPSLSHFLLPSTLNISGFAYTNGYEIEVKFKNLADALNIRFNKDKLPQFRLAHFSGTIEEFKSQLVADPQFDDSGWPARVFDKEQLRFIPIDTNNIDKDFSLVEYRLTEYTYKHRLWNKGQSFDINKNWGRYVILNYHEKHVIFNDRGKNIIAIPSALPLPRLLSEAMTLFSGKAPPRLFLEIQGINTWFNIYENIPPIFASNYFKKVGQTVKEQTINL